MFKFVSFALTLLLCIGLTAGEPIPSMNDQQVEQLEDDQGFLDYMFKFMRFVPFLNHIITPNAQPEDDKDEPSAHDHFKQTVDSSAKNVTEIDEDAGERGHSHNTGEVVELVLTFGDEDELQAAQEIASFNETALNDTASGVCPDAIMSRARCDINARCIMSSSDTRGYICACLEGYVDMSPDPSRQGLICEDEDVDPLCEEYCYNGGVCQMRQGEPHCRCFDHYAGERCEVPSLVLFIVFSCVLGGLSVMIIVTACVGRFRRFCRGTFCCCCGGARLEKRILVECPVDMSSIIFDERDQFGKRDILSTTGTFKKPDLKNVYVY